MKFNKEKALEEYDVPEHYGEKGWNPYGFADWLAEDIECPRCSRTLLPCSYCNNQRTTPRAMMYLENE